MRLLMVNILGPVAIGQKLTQELVNGTIDEIKKQKVRVARGRLKEEEALSIFAVYPPL